MKAADYSPGDIVTGNLASGERYKDQGYDQVLWNDTRMEVMAVQDHMLEVKAIDPRPDRDMLLRMRRNVEDENRPDPQETIMFWPPEHVKLHQRVTDC